MDNIFAYLSEDLSKGLCYNDKEGFQVQGFVNSDYDRYEDSRKSTTEWVFIMAGGLIS